MIATIYNQEPDKDGWLDVHVKPKHDGQYEVEVQWCDIPDIKKNLIDTYSKSNPWNGWGYAQFVNKWREIRIADIAKSIDANEIWEAKEPKPYN